MVMMMTDHNGVSIGCSSSIAEPASQSFQMSRAVRVMTARYVAAWSQCESVVVRTEKKNEMNAFYSYMSKRAHLLHTCS